MSLQDDQAPLDREIWNRVFDHVPSDAVSICLVIEVAGADGHTVYRHTLEARLADGTPRPLTPSDELFAATRALGKMLAERAAGFASARYESFEQPDGRWKTTQHYSYAD
jgi:hypothetical protein